MKERLLVSSVALVGGFAMGMFGSRTSNHGLVADASNVDTVVMAISMVVLAGSNEKIPAAVLLLGFIAGITSQIPDKEPEPAIRL